MSLSRSEGLKAEWETDPQFFEVSHHHVLPNTIFFARAALDTDAELERYLEEEKATIALDWGTNMCR